MELNAGRRQRSRRNGVTVMTRALMTIISLLFALAQMVVGHARYKDGETAAGVIDYGCSVFWIILALIVALG